MKTLTDDALDRLIELHEQWFMSEGREGQQLDLSDYDLAGMEFPPEVRLLQAKFDRANLRKTRIYRTELARGSFNQADFTEAFLFKSELHYSSLVKSKLIQIDGTAIGFMDANLEYADLTQAYLLAARFSGANLQYANLSVAHLQRATFRDANMTYAILQNANLDDAFFSGTRFYGADLHGAQNIETVRVEWIDIGETEPNRLEDEAAREWLRQAAEKGPET